MKDEDEGFKTLPWQQGMCSNGRNSILTSMAAKQTRKRTKSKEKLEQYTERTQPYNDLVQRGLGPFDYITIENPKYQKGVDNQNKSEMSK